MTTLHFDDHGKGPAVVLFHGAPSPPSDWNPLVKALLATHRVLVAHLPGYGKSPRLVPYSLEAVQRLVEDELLRRGVTEASFGGLSLGAYRALSIALSGRVRPRAVALAGGFASLVPEHAQAMRGFAQLLRPMQKVTDPGLRGVVLQRFLSEPFAKSHPREAEQVTGWVDAAPPSVIADELDASAAMPDLLPHVAKLQVPILARTGSADVSAPPVYAEAIGQANARCTVQIVPGAGHALFVEDQAASVAAFAAALA